MVFATKPLPTHTASVRLVTNVGCEVPLHMIASSELLATHTARVRLVSCMGRKVLLDPVDTAKVLFTHRAAMHLDIGMHQLLVSPCVVPPAKSCSANIAGVRLAPFMALDMPLEVVSPAKVLATHVAGVQLVFCAVH